MNASAPFEMPGKWVPGPDIITVPGHYEPPVVHTNLMPNPSATEKLAPGTGGNSVAARSTLWGADGDGASFQIRPLTSSDDSLLHFGDIGAVRFGMQGGKTYTVSATFYQASPQVGPVRSGTRPRGISVFYRTATTQYVERQSVQAANVAGEQRIDFTFTLPAEPTEAFIRFYNGSRNPDDLVHWDHLQLTETRQPLAYFDGNTVSDDPETGYAWTGTPNNSPSTRTHTHWVPPVYGPGPDVYVPGPVIDVYPEPVSLSSSTASANLSSSTSTVSRKGAH